MTEQGRLASIIRRRPKGGWAACLLALAAGCALPLSLAPFDLWFAGLLSISALVALLDGARLRQAALRGYLYGIGMYGVGVSWIYVSIHEHGGASPPLAVFLVALFVLFMALFTALQAWLYVRFLRGGPLGSLAAFPALWVAQEWVRSWLFSGFPWLLAGYAYIDHPLVHWAPIFGVMGISFITVFTAAALFRALHPLFGGPPQTRMERYVTLAALLLLWPGAYVAGAVHWVEPTGRSLRVSAVQGNVAQDSKWSARMRQPILDLYRTETLALPDSDLIVWPEAAITIPLERASPYLDPLAAWARARGITLVTGILSLDPASDRFYNAVVALGAGKGVYHKRALVPFGEYVPLEALLRGLITFFDLPMSHTLEGDARQPGLRAGDLTISTSVCYEVVYPELVRKAVENPDLLLTVSNDTWFGASIGPLQHMQMARMRAVENGRYLVRATNNGVTAIVDTRGRFTARIPQFSRGVLKGRVEVMRGATPYSRFGLWPILALCAVALTGQLWLRHHARFKGWID